MRQLFLCNTVYQIMIALWMKYHYYMNIKTDIIISNHMNGAKSLAERIRSIGIYGDVFYAETIKEARYQVKRNKFENMQMGLKTYDELEKYVILRNEYSDIYVANFDGFTQLLYAALKKKKVGLKLHGFEDGLSTYCEAEKYYKFFENYYEESGKFKSYKHFLHTRIYRLETIYGNLKELFVFNPEMMQWNPGCPVRQMDKINQSDRSFVQLINQVFEVDKSEDRYDRKYIFFEESFFADGESINDVELVQQLAERVGKNNIMIKIHPRNPINRFAELGFKTNVDTSIPWEVILMGMNDVSDKVFLTVASSAILNPIMIFGVKIRAYSLYPCLKVIPNRLHGESWDFLQNIFAKYPDMIKMCYDMNDIE